MCTFMIMRKDRYNPDPIIQATLCPLAGDFVDIRGDVVLWGAMESKQEWIAQGNDPALWHGMTFLIKVPGLEMAKVIAVLDRDIVNEIMRARGVWHIPLSVIPQSIMDVIDQDGEYTVTITQLRNFIKKKLDNSSFPGI